MNQTSPSGTWIVTAPDEQCVQLDNEAGLLLSPTTRLRLGVRPPQFPEVEDLLYMKFIHRRLYQGLIVRDAWLRREFKRCLEEVQPDGWERAKVSKGWCYRFCRRYQITNKVTAMHTTPHSRVGGSR
jgi:hypothetical protein